jgi:hypothetical protein
VDQTIPNVTGAIWKHQTPTDPDSPLAGQVGATLTYTKALPAGVTSPGEAGILGSAIAAVLRASVTNFSNDPTRCSR